MVIGDFQWTGPMTSSQDQLSQLSDRAKQVRQRVAHARTQTKSDLEKAVTGSGATAKAQATELRDRANAVKDKLTAWGDEEQTAWNDNAAKLRKDLDDKKAGHDANRAEEQAEKAEADADFAVQFAYATIDEAEYAVPSSILARNRTDVSAADKR